MQTVQENSQLWKMGIVLSATVNLVRIHVALERST